MFNKKLLQKSIIHIIFILPSSFHITYSFAQSAVTYVPANGRFGDNLVAYCHAAWIAYKYDIPLLYKPFIYSSELSLHDTPYIFDKNKRFNQIVQLNIHTLINRDSGTLYIVPYFPESNFESPHLFYVDWSDQKFIKHLKNLLKPRKTITALELPHDKICVALHIRTLSGPDLVEPKGFLKKLSLTQLEIEALTPDHFLQKLVALKYPYASNKFLPNEYYLDQLKKIAELCKDHQLYVYLFTDHNKPEEIAELYRKELSEYNIIFAYRKNGNIHDRNVLEDFFALTQFDCLVRSDSNFSLIAAKLTTYKIHIYPESINFIAGKLTIKPHIEINDSGITVKASA